MNFADLIKVSAGRASVCLHRLLPPTPRASVGILLYHRISPIFEGASKPDGNVTPEQLRFQLEGLLERGYEFCKLQDVLDCVAEGRPVPEQAVIVTFDDGFENVYLNAWPVLQDMGIPATIFLNTAFLGSNEPFPFDPWGLAFRDHVPREAFRPLNVDQCREMLASGIIELGAHTHTHGDFRGRPDALADDLQENLRGLHDAFAIPVDDVTFAFPHGRVAMGYAGGEMSEAARRVGVRCALTTECDRNLVDGNAFGWGRCNVYDWDTPDTLQAKLAGWYSWAPKLQETLSPETRKLSIRHTTPEPRKPVLDRLHDRVESRVGPRAMRGGLGLADQAIVSGSRFAVTILLGRVCGADQLGEYGLGFSVIVLIACIQSALITLPYTVNAPAKKGRRGEFYAGSAFLHYIVFALLASLLLGLASLTRASQLGASDLVRVFAAIALVTPFLLLWEFARRFGFARLSAGWVLRLDAWAAITFIGGLCGLAITGRLSAVNVYIVMGIGYGLVSAIWLLRERQRFRFSWRLAGRELLPHWRFGRWAFASETALMARGYIVPWMVAIWLDSTATGIFVAYATIVVLANPILIGFSNVLTPDLALTHANEGVPAVRSFVIRSTASICAAMLLFTFFLMLFGERLIAATYGSDFGGYQACVFILAVGVLAEAAGMPSYTGLWSIGCPNLCFAACVAGLVVTVVLTAGMTPWLGITGAAIGFSSGKAVSAVVQVIAFAAVTRRRWQGAVAA